MTPEDMQHGNWGEKRRGRRFLLDTPVIIAADDPDAGLAAIGRTLDVSQTGIGTLLAIAWPVGLLAYLEFQVPVTAESLKLRGVLRNNSGNRFGFEFVNLKPGEREILGKTCEHLATSALD